jgi:hypothetical protein
MGWGCRIRWIRGEIDPRIIKGLTFAKSAAPGTIFHDGGIKIFGHDLVGAVIRFVITTKKVLLFPSLKSSSSLHTSGNKNSMQKQRWRCSQPVFLRHENEETSIGNMSVGMDLQNHQQ